MTTVAAASVLLGMILWLRADHPLVARHAEEALLLILLVVAGNSLTHLYFSADIKQTTNVIFVLAIAGYVLPGNRYFWTLVGSTMAGWTWIISVSVGWPEEAIHFAFALVMGGLFAFFLHVLRRNQLAQLEDLESTIEQLNESEKQVKASQSLVQKVLENVPAGIIVRGQDTRIQFINNEVMRILGVEEEDLIGLPSDQDPLVLYGYDEKLVPKNQLPVNRILRTGEPVVNEILGAKRDNGEFVWALVNGFLVSPGADEGDLIMVSFIDISERIKVERQLRESEDRANTILKSVAEGVISVDHRNRITLFNTGAEMLTGFTEHAALGQPFDDIVQFSETVEEISVPLDGTMPVRQGILRHRDGEEAAVELFSSDIHAGELLVGRVFTFRDVSEQLRIEQERATVDKMSSVGLLAGGIAHDFNNLLTAIYGNVSLAEGVIDQPEKAREFLRNADESIKQATHLTKQLLTFATGSDPVRDVVSVEEMVREATRFALSGSSIAVTFDIAEHLPGIEVDAGQVQQAIGNIILNAKQALNDQGQIRIRISEAAEPSGYVNISIADDGPGIEPDVLQRIFDPYFTTKSTGTGLGLATTHSIIVKHGGSLNVESTMGKGTTFTLLIPAGKGEAVNQAADDHDSRAQPGALNVLVMDDEEVVLQTVTRLLEHLGHRATGTRDGEAVIAEYARCQDSDRSYDLVIMDLTVAGGMGGMEAASEILKEDPDARLIVSSGYSAGAEMARYEELGFCGRLEKPFRAAELKKAIAAALVSTAG